MTFFFFENYTHSSKCSYLIDLFGTSWFGDSCEENASLKAVYVLSDFKNKHPKQVLVYILCTDLIY